MGNAPWLLGVGLMVGFWIGCIMTRLGVMDRITRWMMRHGR